MDVEEKKKRRIRFNWHDALTLVLVVAATAGVFIWSSFQGGSVLTTNSTVLVRYANLTVADNLTVTTQSGDKLTYAVSFRRELSQGETYSIPSSYSQAPSLNFSVYELKQITDFSLYQNKYLIVTADEKTPELQGFNILGLSLYGPQVDLLISQGGIRVIKEDSPYHDCSKQGQVNQANLPLVCLPNHLTFQIISAQPGPDA
ncbi:MAG: NusG domain II-containing protein [Bacilli bacterium]|jgi:hypothetical protein|nr:NusG domain II-containing protein [Bacilli bacterium]